MTPTSEATRASRWCVVAKVVEERPCGDGGERTVRGTKHFRPGAKVYVFGFCAGMCDSVVVVARHRGSNRYIKLTMKARHLTDFRPRVVYSPGILRLMGESSPGCAVVTDEQSAKSWAEGLPSWR